jgi:glucan-binding YG repeat protein
MLYKNNHWEDIKVMRIKLTLKKVISYLLMFTILFGGIQLTNTKIAKAAEATFTDKIVLRSDLTLNSPVVVDNVNNARLTYENINLATTHFYINAVDGYEITDITYPTDGSLAESKTSISGKINYDYEIKKYANFTYNISVQKTDGTGKITYTIYMKYDMSSLLEFSSINLYYTDTDNKITTSSIPFTGRDTDGTYRTQTPNEKVNKVKVNLFKDQALMNDGVLVNGKSPDTEVELIGGDNLITITVTRNNATKQYDLVINKKGVALLNGIEPSVGSLTPAFDKNTYEYTVNVPTTQTTIQFKPTAVDNASTIKVGKNVVKSGTNSGIISLSEGTNKIEIKVETPEASQTYVVKVIRAEAFRSANLSGLVLSSGTLDPAFNKEVYNYNVSVDNSMSAITITPTAEDPAATIKINDVKVPSGAASGSINLDEGGNIITITVTDSKGNTNTYTLSVSRRYSADNVNLGSLTVTDGTLSPKFDPETYAYSVKTARNIERVRVLYKLQNDKAKITINGKEYKSGQQSDYIKLDIGANLVVVQVTAEDGKTTTTYKLSIIRGDIEAKNQWVIVAGDWTFYNAEGLQIKNQWVKYNNQWYFLDINGNRKTGWLSESGKWFYLNTDGIMQTGWLYDRGYWYYLQGDGAMNVSTWSTYDGKWYYFNNFGEVQTGWVQYKGKWYYMDDHGAMQKGWMTYDKNKYYLNDDGSMRYGWLYTGKTWNYLDGTGKMVRGWQVVDGKRYYFDANGVMKTGMMFLDGQWVNLNNA